MVLGLPTIGLRSELELRGQGDDANAGELIDIYNSELGIGKIDKAFDSLYQPGSVSQLGYGASKDIAGDYKRQRNTELDQQVPRWDISLTDLKRVYDQARFDRYLDWESCSKKRFKRRIPWLYARNGFYFTFE